MFTCYNHNWNNHESPCPLCPSVFKTATTLDCAITNPPHAKSNEAKPREWNLNDGLISWSHGRVRVIEYSAYEALEAKCAKYEAALMKIHGQPFNGSWDAQAVFIQNIPGIYEAFQARREHK